MYVSSQRNEYMNDRIVRFMALEPVAGKAAMYDRLRLLVCMCVCVCVCVRALAPLDRIDRIATLLNSCVNAAGFFFLLVLSS